MLEEEEHSAEAADAHKANQYEDRQRKAKGAVVVFHIPIIPSLEQFVNLIPVFICGFF